MTFQTLSQNHYCRLIAIVKSKNKRFLEKKGIRIELMDMESFHLLFLSQDHEDGRDLGRHGNLSTCPWEWLGAISSWYFPLGLFCLLRSAFFLYRFVKYNYYKLKCSSFEVCVIQVGFLNDCFWNAEMHNKINNVSMGRNTECSFATLGIFEKPECIYSEWRSPERHASNSALNGGLVWWQRGTVVFEGFQQF